MMRWIFILISMFLISSCEPGLEAYHRGNQAYQQGKYDISFENYLYAANHGIISAEYAVGYQYYYGQGTKQNAALGITWFQRAAEYSPRAQYALHLIHQHAPQQPWEFNLK